MIYAYGDSYTEDTQHSASWVKHLANKMESRIVNQSIGGSSTEYSIKQFIKNLKLYKPGDTIIFCFSTVGRLNLKYINDKIPRTACSFYNDYKTNPNCGWYLEHEDHLKWYVNEIDFDLLDINFEGYHHILKNFADKNPEITVFVIVNTKHTYFNDSSIENTNNYIRANIELSKISSAETGEMTYDDFTFHTKVDPRANHLVEQNRKILVEAVYKAIQTKSTEHITNDIFLKDIITAIKTFDEYKNYVNNGTILPNSDISKKLKYPF